MAVSTLLGVRDEDRAVHILDAKRCVTGRDLGVDEGARHADRLEAPIENVDASVVEVSRVQKVVRRSRGDRKALVNGAEAGVVGGDLCLRRRNIRVPAENLALLSRE